METLNTNLDGNVQSSADTSATQKPVIRSITPRDAQAVPVSAQQQVQPEQNSSVEHKESIFGKIDSGLKSIDTTGEYLMVTIVALLVGVVIGLLISSFMM